MSTLILKDLAENVELDASAMASVRGGLNAAIGNSQTANQGGLGGFGGMGGFGLVALNTPINVPTTVLTEVNPNIEINLGLSNLIGSAQNQLKG